MNRHLDDDKLIDRIYGLTGSEDDSHLENCDTCATRQSDLERRRMELARPPAEVSNEFLTAQRRHIYARLGQSPRSKIRWVPAFAAACLLALGVAVYRPAHVPVQHADALDAQLFADVYSMAENTEPLAAEPIQALLDDNQ